MLDKLAADAQGGSSPRCKGIGLSGHMHGATLLDAADKPLRPCILWNDVRSAEEAAELDGDARFRAITGNIVFPGFTAPKLVWVARHEPAIFAKVAKVLLPKDYVRLKLTGDYASDMSDSAGTSWLDVAQARLERRAARRDRASPARRCRSSSRAPPATGVLRAELAQRWGMTRQPVVAGGGGDNAASACGVGVVKPGTAFVSLGTSGVLFVSNARFSPDPATAVHAFCHARAGHLAPDGRDPLGRRRARMARRHLRDQRRRADPAAGSR